MRRYESPLKRVFCQVALYGVVTFSRQFRRSFWTVWAVRFPIGAVWLFHQ